MTGLVRVGLLFGALAVVVAVAIAGNVAGALRARGSPRAATWLTRASTAARLVIALGTLAVLYSLFVEADWLQVSTVRVESPKVPTGREYTIAVVSDLHVDHDTRALIALRDELRTNPVDLVVFTGDAINRREAVDLFRATMVSLGGRLGRTAVKGNHDVYRWGDVELFSGVATELLSDRPVLIDAGRIALCGAPFGGTDAVEACLAAVPQGSLSLFVYHSPDLIEALQHRPDLYLAGHTHGGQVRLPFFGALVTMSQFDKRYEAGRYDVDGTTLVVSRGIGFEPGLPRLRFLCRPELVRVEVVGTGPSPER
jgi:predicted MPP superfamily phosphohydrolase